ncbi:urease subunit gamma [Streptomyces parvus]|uniref:urease subunit gamma n=1 Tax=Streptomyces parvus TaxID=66428 RepID=UPI0034047E20
MPLTPTERDRVPLFTAARPARVRRARGLRLAVPGAAVLIADAVCEAARGGHRPAVALERGRSVLTPDGILLGVADVATGIHAYGMRPAAPAGVSTRFDAGGTVGVGLVPMGRVRTATRRRIGIVRPPPDTMATRRRRVAVRGTRAIGPAGVASDRRTGEFQVDSRDGPVAPDGKPLRSEPADSASLSRLDQLSPLPLNRSRLPMPARLTEFSVDAPC